MMFLFPLTFAVWLTTVHCEIPKRKDLLEERSEIRSGNEDIVELRRELATLKRKLNQEVMARRSEVESMNRTLVGLKSGLSRNDVNFEVTTSRHVTMHPEQTYKFDTVVLNNGGGYHAPTGIFEAPVSGTYLFWGNAYHSTKWVHLILVKEGVALAISADGSLHGECNLVYLAEVRKGEKLWFKSGNYVAKIYGYKHASYGGVLIHAH